MHPWEKSPLEVEIIEGHEAEIIGEEGEEFFVAFPDRDGEKIEAKIDKKQFEGFPYSVDEGTYFGIIVYREDNQTKAGAWPTAEYWNPELRKE